MKRHPTLNRQRGAVLIVGLVMLLVLTVLGVASSRNTTLEERMSGNFRDRNLALQAAEAALRAGEAELGDPTTFAAMKFDGTDGTYEGNPSEDPLDATTYSKTVTDATLNAQLASNPTYYIERLPEFTAPQSSLVVGTGGSPPPTMRLYRITGKGQGQSTSAEVILQSSYFTL